jgi:hypothetical protein
MAGPESIADFLQQRNEYDKAKRAAREVILIRLKIRTITEIQYD